MEGKAPTSTKTITRLGALTVIASCSPDDSVRAKARKEVRHIMGGGTHVPTWKVRDRSMERCLIGSVCVGGITGLN